MKSFVLTARRAVFGLPLYISWNLTAYVKEQEGSAARAMVATCAILTAAFTTALWAAAWLLPSGPCSLCGRGGKEVAERTEAPQMNLVQIAKMAAISLSRDLPLSMQFRLGLKTSADIDAAVSYAIQISNHCLTQLAERGIPLSGTRILEIGPGMDFAPQLVLASHGAKLVLADRFLSKWNDAYHPEFYRRFKAQWSGPSAAIDEVIAANGYPADLITCIAEPAEALRSVADASCDVVFSTSVLEHVYDLPAVCRSLARVTKPSGVGIHSIDFRDHWNFDQPLDFLLFDPKSRVTRGRVGRGNRLRPSEHLAQFREAGFRIDALTPYAPPAADYFDAFLPRLRASSSPYRDSPEDDLKVLGALMTVVRSERR